MTTSAVKTTPPFEAPPYEMPPEDAPPGLPWQRLAEIHEMTRDQPNPEIWDTLNKAPAQTRPARATANE
ncbi:MAG: hypothetical protein LDL31_12195 [Prosthecobacter sp.]|jgi:hypothetical protein|nr:hypothetical protein [Prosthecobacter sp.]